MTKRHAIITSCDAKYEDFLVEHWLNSLRANVTLDNIDVLVIDYGLSEKRRRELDDRGVRRFVGTRDRTPVNARIRDMATILADDAYDQVLIVDGGDLIFQSDIAHLFEQNKDFYRGACEEHAVPLHDFIVSHQDFYPEQYADMAVFLRGKPVINMGFVIAPAAKLRDWWPQFQKLTRKTETWGTDQFVANYLMYRDGFHRLDEGYNFVIISTQTPFKIRKGVFCDAIGGVIPVVHNAGKYDAVRFVRRFGYGPDRNIRRRIRPMVLRWLFFGSLWCYQRFKNAQQGQRFRRTRRLAPVLPDDPQVRLCK